MPINATVLLLGLLLFTGAHVWLRRLHGRRFNLGDTQFHATHDAAMCGHKLAILVLYLAPRLAPALSGAG